MRLPLLILCSLCLAAADPTARAGKYEVLLRLPADGLHAQEEMQIEYRVVDTTQVDPLMGAAPVIRANTRSIINMPVMPGMAKIVETAHPEGIPGEYGVHPLFPHGGEYQLTLEITPPGAAAFSVQFPLQVGDAATAKKRKPKPFSAEIKSNPKTPKAGEPVQLEVLVKSLAGQGAVVQEFDIQHERPMHLIIVRSDLGAFAHEHPKPTATGAFHLEYVFPTAGEYTLFVDVAPKSAGGQVIPVKLKVAGKKPERFSLSTAPANAKGENLIATMPRTPFAVGRTLRINCKVTDPDSGAPVENFDPYLGALGHLILVHEDGETFVHSHPDELDPQAGKQGNIPFLARFPKPGLYRGWVQIQRAGVLNTVAFLANAGGQ